MCYVYVGWCLRDDEPDFVGLLNLNRVTNQQLTLQALLVACRNQCFSRQEQLIV